MSRFHLCQLSNDQTHCLLDTKIMSTIHINFVNTTHKKEFCKVDYPLLFIWYLIN